MPPNCRVDDAPMRNFVARFLTRADPSYGEARRPDAAAMAAIHAASFQRGWAEDEFDQLLRDPCVIAHRAMLGAAMIGFILSRFVAGEAEILSVALAPASRGRGFAGPLLALHLRRLAGLGTRQVFLEVDAANAPARALYQRAGFYAVGERHGYYQESGGTAVVLRRDLG